MAFRPMRTALLVVLVVAVAIAAALTAPLAGAKAKVSIQLSPSPAGVRVEVESTTSRPLVLFLDGHRVSSRTGAGLTVTVPLRFVSLDSSRIVVRDGKSRSVLASQTFAGRYFLKPRAPQLALTATPMGPTTARTATITWRTNGGRTSCAIDGRAPISCVSPLRLDGLDLGRARRQRHRVRAQLRQLGPRDLDGPQEPARNEALRRETPPARRIRPRPRPATPTTTTPKDHDHDHPDATAGISACDHDAGGVRPTVYDDACLGCVSVRRRVQRDQHRHEQVDAELVRRRRPRQQRRGGRVQLEPSQRRRRLPLDDADGGPDLLLEAR